MSQRSPEVLHLVAQREEARNARDFARADALRDEVAALGFDVRDTPQGPVVTPRPKFETFDPAQIESVLDQPATCEFSIHLLHEGFPSDVERFLAGLDRHCAQRDYEVVIVDNAGPDGEWLESLSSERLGVLHLDREAGYAQARNAGLKTSGGRIVVLADLSVEPTGDLLGAVTDALADPQAGVAGPWGLVSEDLREFTESPGPEVDAIEGYFLATRREHLAKGLMDEKFRWYRHADIDLSFQIRSYGTKAVVTAAPALRHAHRGWEALTEDERAKRSKRNWYRFLQRWRHHHGMLVSHRD